MKKLIIILIIIVLLLLSILLLLTRKTTPKKTESKVFENLPTGFIAPTTSLNQKAFDIVKVEPQDQSADISVTKTIEITFSQNVDTTKYDFFLAPNTEFTQEIIGNRLLIKPTLSWTPGTLYTYSFNFKDDNQKVRLYRFMTTGPTQSTLPDTQNQGEFEKEQQREKEQYTDIYVANQTPYDFTSFSITSEFEPSQPPHNYFIVIAKNTDLEKVKNDVKLWLMGLDLSDEQINKLDIRYK